MLPLILARPAVVFAASLALLPMLAAGIVPERFCAAVKGLPSTARIIVPGMLFVPYALTALAVGRFSAYWLAVYALLPVFIAWMTQQAAKSDPEQRGNWRDYLLLAGLGLAVDLRWLEPAWPNGLTAMGKMLLVDAGIYGFLGVRQLRGVGFDIRLRLSDLRKGLREFLYYAPIAIPLGLLLGFLHFRAGWPTLSQSLVAYLFTFFFIAIPEELYFRGWVQNLLERRMSRGSSLLITSVLFGLAHWNKRTTSFNWEYVLLATLAGIFYGRAWRAEKRVGASAITHATVDTMWSLWLK